MTGVWKKNIIKGFVWIMFAVISFIAVNKALFTHSHILADGTIITHAHPYNKSQDSQPFKTHHHTNLELLFFENLELLFPAIFFILAIFRAQLHFKCPCAEIKELSLTHISYYYWRGPPAC